MSSFNFVYGGFKKRKKDDGTRIVERSVPKRCPHCGSIYYEKTVGLERPIQPAPLNKKVFDD